MVTLLFDVYTCASPEACVVESPAVVLLCLHGLWIMHLQTVGALPVLVLFANTVRQEVGV